MHEILEFYCHFSLNQSRSTNVYVLHLSRIYVNGVVFHVSKNRFCALELIMQRVIFAFSF